MCRYAFVKQIGNLNNNNHQITNLETAEIRFFHSSMYHSLSRFLQASIYHSVPSTILFSSEDLMSCLFFCMIFMSVHFCSVYFLIHVFFSQTYFFLPKRPGRVCVPPTPLCNVNCERVCSLE